MEPGTPTNRPQWMPLFNGQSNDDALDFGNIFSIFRRRGLVVVGCAIIGGTLGGIVGIKKPDYQGDFQLLTKPLTAEGQVVSSLKQSVDVSGGSTPATGPGTSRGLDPTKARLLYSLAVLEPVYKELLTEYPDLKYDKLVKQIDVKAVPDTEIVVVRYTDSNPNRVTSVLQALSDRYIKYSLEERRAETTQGLEFIDKQLPELQDKVRLLQQRLQTFRQENTFFDPESQNREISDQLSNFRKQRLDNTVQLKQATALYGDLQREIDANRGERTAGAALRQSQGYQKLLDQLLVVDGKIAQDGAIYLPNSEDMMILRDERARILSLMERESTRAKDEVGSQVRDLQAKESALKTTEQGLSDRMRDLSRVAREYTAIQGELQIATDNLNQFLAKKSTLQINIGEQVTPWQAISPPSIPELTSLKSNALIGTILGLLSGIAAALLIDRAINVFYTSDEIKKASKYPLLGIIPYNRELTQIERNLSNRNSNHHESSRSGTFSRLGTIPFLEAFRLLSTNLRLTNAQTPVKSIVITSAMAGDGKSTVALYLARAAASMGQRVLLVDAELRRPQQHYRLGLSNQQGLSNALQSNLDISEFIQPWPINPNIHILTAGPSASDPIPLLASQRMQQIMARFTEDYDLVIYDTPPIGTLSDALLVASHADGLLLVTRIKKTKQDAVAQAIEALQMIPSRVLGIVANDSRKIQRNSGYPLTAIPFETLPAAAPTPALNPRT
jgi:succinoglycan biosynthesis transport protein ExoP